MRVTSDMTTDLEQTRRLVAESRQQADEAMEIARRARAEADMALDEHNDLKRADLKRAGAGSLLDAKDAENAEDVENDDDAEDRSTEKQVDEPGFENTANGGTDDGDASSTRSARGMWAARTVSLIVIVAAVGILYAAVEFRQDRAAGRDDHAAVDAARMAVSQIVDVDAANPRGYVERVLSSATGSWKSDFESRKDDLVSMLGSAESESTFRVVAAGMERRLPSGGRVVLVAVTTAPAAEESSDRSDAQKQKPSAESAEASKTLRLRVVVDLDSGSRKISKVEFVA